ncbi:MAG TPA: Ig-like domain-containing protein, partial [Vicinamibacteria bacterium]|nr:Ig-like domain-containing protein [Vicinamibacteria bacterium]
MRQAVLLLCATIGAAVPAAAGELKVRSAGPSGEIASLDQANEVRVVFAEPMVALGRIPDPVTAPFFAIAPAVKGSFRWAGTDTLIFKPAAPLPFATRFTVTIATSAVSVKGNALQEPYTFSFTTPTVKLLRTSWYRKTRLFDSPVVIALRFNQPVEPLEVSKHLSLRYEPHPWNPPSLPAATRDRLSAIDPPSAADFEAKVARAQAATQSTAVVPYFNATTWDQKSFPPSNDLVVLETKEVPPTDGWIHIWLDGQVPSSAGGEAPREEQKYTVKLEATLFVDGPGCSAACDPESYNPLRLRASVTPTQVRRSLSVWDVT